MKIKVFGIAAFFAFIFVFLQSANAELLLNTTDANSYANSSFTNLTSPRVNSITINVTTNESWDGGNRSYVEWTNQSGIVTNFTAGIMSNISQFNQTGAGVLNYTFFNLSAAQNVTLLQGTHQLRLVVYGGSRNDDTNSSQVFSYNFTYENNAYEIRVATVNNSWVNTSRTTVYFTVAKSIQNNANRSAARCGWFNDTQAFTPFDNCNNFTVTFHTEGTAAENHTFSIAINDSTGTANRSANYTVRLDAIAPVLTVNHPVNNTDIVSPVTTTDLNFTTNDTNRDVCVYDLNNGGNTSVSGCTNITITPATGSTNTLRVYFNDSAGNIDVEVYTFTFRITSPGGSGGGGGGGTTPSVSRTSFSVNVQTPAGVRKEILITGTEIKVDRIEIFAVTPLDGNIEVRKLFDKPASIPAIRGKVNNYIEITYPFSSSNFAAIGMDFSVEKSWLAAESVPQSNIVLLRYDPIISAWKAQRTSILGEDSTVIKYRAELEGLSLFAVGTLDAAGVPLEVQQPIIKTGEFPLSVDETINRGINIGGTEIPVWLLIAAVFFFVILVVVVRRVV